MSKEGFLILHESDKSSSIFYCVLGEGKLRFFSMRQNGVLHKELPLSKSCIKVKGVATEEARGCPCSLRVTIHKSKIIEGKQIVFGKPTILLLSAPTSAERRSWGNAIFSWQRNYWGEPQHRLSNMTEQEADEFFNDQYRMLQTNLRQSFAQSTSATVKQTAQQLSDPEMVSDAGHSDDQTAPDTHKRSTTASRISSLRIPVSTQIFARARSMKLAATKKLRPSSHSETKSTTESMTFSLPPMAVTMCSTLQQQVPATCSPMPFDSSS